MDSKVSNRSMTTSKLTSPKPLVNAANTSKRRGSLGNVSTFMLMKQLIKLTLCVRSSTITFSHTISPKATGCSSITESPSRLRKRAFVHLLLRLHFLDLQFHRFLAVAGQRDLLGMLDAAHF